MSVLVKDMEMPIRCIDCPMCHDYHYCLLLDKSFGEFDCTEYRWDYCPLVPVEPRPKGEWEYLYDGNYKCSECGSCWTCEGTPIESGLNYCPNCGAEMEVGI